ncbi:Bug family tripartite tricarboxylate transporter substrate binding protein [Achromobacter sp. NPDC058515]|uniref:Bug family tripartite tricarboxylate transporter substrate binding protein n=1 Tax=Achromobacter sp. NPDC058515 TaxID=3346533 RepID=UPI00364D1274
MMAWTRKCCALAMALLVFCPPAMSAYPDKPIRWIVPFAAGGGTDVVSRMLAEAMGASLGQSLIVENKPGAGTMIGAAEVARASSDGYTVGTVDVSTVALNPNLYATVAYDANKDFQYLGGTARFPFVLVVNPAIPAKDLPSLLTLGRSSSKPLSYATPGAGGPNHLGMELLQQMADIKLLHVPYRGDAPALQDLIGGQVDMYLVNTAASLPYIRAGKVRALAVASRERLASLPDVPTFDEAGVAGFEAYAWQGLAAPAGTPADRAAMLADALAKALADAAVRTRLADLGVEPFLMPPLEFNEHVRSETAKWRDIIGQAGIKLE